MKEIVERLQESRQIDRAKHLLESEGYNVIKPNDESTLNESVSGYTWSDWSSAYGTGNKYKTYDLKDVEESLYAEVYEPGDYDGEVYDTYTAAIYDPKDHDNIVKTQDTNNEEEAVEWVEETIKQLTGQGNSTEKLDNIDKELTDLGFTRIHKKKGDTTITYYEKDGYNVLVVDDAHLVSALDSIS